MDSYSAKIKINRQRINNEGCAAIFMQVIINRRKTTIDLKLKWPVLKFNEDEGRCLKRYKDDPDVNDYNMLIVQELAKANEIFKYYRLAEINLNIETFIKDFRNNLSKTDFIAYLEDKIEERFNSREIEFLTRKNHRQTLSKLKAWKKELLFKDLDNKTAKSFDGFLKKNIKSKNGKSGNTRWTHHRNLNTYLKFAKDDNIKFVDPYDFFTFSSERGDWASISQDDFKALYKYYITTEEKNHRLVLRIFLFSCLTGLRLSDLVLLKKYMFRDYMLSIVPWKNRKKNRVLNLPMNDLAKKLLDDAIAEKGNGLLFNDFEDQSRNRTLKKIAQKLKLKCNLHHHIGRHTFATLFLEAGGKLEMLQEYMQHFNIRNTMKYVHISEHRIRDEMDVMNTLKLQD